MLGELFRAEEQGELTGREKILEAARKSHFPLSQREVRESLAQLAAAGLAKVSRGRGGSRITPAGRKAWEDLQVRKPV